MQHCLKPTGTLILLILAAAPLMAQESRPTTRPRTQSSAPTLRRPQSAPHASQEEARRLLYNAIRLQAGLLPRGTVKNFEGHFKFEVQIPKTADKPARRVEGQYHQYWAFRKRDGRTRFAYRRSIEADLSDWQSTLVSDFDDEIFGVDGKRPIAVRGAEYAEDRRRIREEKRAARRLFSLLFLNELNPIDSTLRIEARNVPCPIKIGNVSRRIRMGSRSATIVSFRNREGQQIKLWIDTAEGATPEVMKAEVLDPRAPLYAEDSRGRKRRVPEVFELGYYTDISLPTKERIRFPLRVRYSVGKKEAMTITVHDPRRIKINGLKNLSRLFEAE